MKPTVKVTSSGSGDPLKAALAKLSRAEVLVGIPEAETARNEPGVTNAGLLHIHTNGSPIQNIPARPVIEPAIEAANNKRLITNELGEAAESILDGNAIEARQHLEKAGMLGANASKRWFTDSRNGWAPNSPLTIAIKGSDRPLIDTGQLRRAITHVVKES